MENHCLNCAQLYLHPHQQGCSDLTPSAAMSLRCGAGLWDAEDMHGRQELANVMEASRTCQKFVPDEPSRVFDLGGNQVLSEPGRVILSDEHTMRVTVYTEDKDRADYLRHLRECHDKGVALNDDQMRDMTKGRADKPTHSLVHAFVRVGRTSEFREVP